MNNLILVGYPACGKTYLSKKINLLFNYKIIEMGDYVREESKNFKNNCFDCFNYYLLNNDPLHFACLALEERTKSPLENCIIVGVRTLEELEFFKSNLSNLTSIAILSDYDIRKSRRENQSERNQIIDLIRRDEIERCWGLDKTIEMCDYKIINNYILQNKVGDFNEPKC